ncbi:M14 family metallopeptidase [Planctobacterium marinum]|uniref:Peptidase n=1 Tax=Planctobacterium marinum TaxID=1631968 RepID=A0AA48KSC3_9ALTE|nr:peptidase [Planctobacterium marinum]
MSKIDRPEVAYPVGVPGTPWGDTEKTQWYTMQAIKRSYQEEVLSKIEQLSEAWQVEQYGALSYDPSRYPLFVLRSKNWQSNLPVALITGGVHGYETSGVQGALFFLQHFAQNYDGKVNLVVAPCLSPWGYETINRWNPKAVDPNRSFIFGAPSEETQAIMHYLKDNHIAPLVHVDLHETTDTDNSEFRPALAARDGVTHDNWDIPDGFYLVGDTKRSEDAFQKAIIDSVAKITHIAPADQNGNIIGDKVVQHGVIEYDCKKAGLCAGMTDAQYVTTTEVYPDSPKTDPQNCMEAQAAAITGALNFVLADS